MANKLFLRRYIDLPFHTEGNFDHGDVYLESGRMFVANTAAGTVEVIDGERLRHLATIPGCPEARLSQGGFLGQVMKSVGASTMESTGARGTRATLSSSYPGCGWVPSATRATQGSPPFLSSAPAPTGNLPVKAEARGYFVLRMRR